MVTHAQMMAVVLFLRDIECAEDLPGKLRAAAAGHRKIVEGGAQLLLEAHECLNTLSEQLAAETALHMALRAAERGRSN